MTLQPQNSHNANLTNVADTLLSAFEAGRLLNQLDWYLTKYEILREEKDRERWEEILADLIPTALKLAPNTLAGRAAQALISEASEDWRAWFTCRYLPDSSEMCWTAWNDLEHSPWDGSSVPQLIERYFSDVIRDANFRLMRICHIFQRNLETLPDIIQRAFFLGETIDQGLHPPGIQDHLIERSIRSPESPTSKRFVGRARLPGELPPPDGWANSVRARCAGLGIRSSLPDELFRQTPLAIVEHLVEKCVQGLAQHTNVANENPDDSTAIDNAFVELLKFASENLKGKERRIIELICVHHGECVLADLAIDATIQWNKPYDDSFNSARQRINKKLRKTGWRISRQDGKAKISHLGRK